MSKRAVAEHTRAIIAVAVAHMAALFSLYLEQVSTNIQPGATASGT